jgi:MFS family permease
MTGILFMVGSIARTIGPIIVSILFDHYGPEITWIMEIVVLSFTIALWIIFYKKMKPFKNFSHEAAIDSCKSINGASNNVTQNEVAKL